MTNTNADRCAEAINKVAEATSQFITTEWLMTYPITEETHDEFWADTNRMIPILRAIFLTLKEDEYATLQSNERTNRIVAGEQINFLVKCGFGVEAALREVAPDQPFAVH